MLGSLVQAALDAVNNQAPWQVSCRHTREYKLTVVKDIEAILHCIRYSAEGVPLGEERDLPVLFGQVLGEIGRRQSSGRGETRLKSTTVLTIREPPRSVRERAHVL